MSFKLKARPSCIPCLFWCERESNFSCQSIMTKRKVTPFFTMESDATFALTCETLQVDGRLPSHGLTCCANMMETRLVCASQVARQASTCRRGMAIYVQPSSWLSSQPVQRHRGRALACRERRTETSESLQPPPGRCHRSKLVERVLVLLQVLAELHSRMLVSRPHARAAGDAQLMAGTGCAHDAAHRVARRGAARLLPQRLPCAAVHSATLFSENPVRNCPKKTYLFWQVPLLEHQSAIRQPQTRAWVAREWLYARFCCIRRLMHIRFGD